MTAAGHGGPNRNIFPIAGASASVAGQPTVRIFLNNRALLLRPRANRRPGRISRGRLPQRSPARQTDDTPALFLSDGKADGRSCGTHAASNGRPLGDAPCPLQPPETHRHGPHACLAYRPSLPPMRHCIYPGTFDPITCGHLDVLARAARLFDRVTVAVAENAGKGPLFTAQERVAMIRPNVAQFPHVAVTTFSGLLVEFCMEQKADAIIRGLRALSDFEFEFNMALMNRHLEPQMETLFVMPNEQFSYTSSTLVKQVAKFGGDVAHFVPPNVATALRTAFQSA